MRFAPSSPRKKRAAALSVVSVVLAQMFGIAPGTFAVPSVFAANGLVAAYSFDEGTGTTVNDLSGNGNNGTITAATWSTTNFKYGKALDFNGTSARVSINDNVNGSLDLTTGMTLEAWVRPTVNTSYRTVILKEIPAELSYALYAADSDHAKHPSGWVRVGGTSQFIDATAVPALSVWTHLATTYDGANMKFYVNGVLVRTKAVTGSIQISDNPLRIGSNAIWGEYFKGQIDEVRVYNRSLSVGEITTDMSAPLGTPDTTPPTVSMTSPADASTVSGNAVTVSANAADNIGVAGVQFKLDGANVGAEDTVSPYSISWNSATVANGTHTLTAVARDAAGNTTTATSVSVTVSNDVTPPTVSVTAPSEGATVANTVSITADATDNVGVAGVQFKVDGTNMGAEDTASPYSVSWDTTLSANGAHTLTALARDAAGNTTTSTLVHVTVNNVDAVPPTVSMTAPLNGKTVTATIPVSATAADNIGVAGVQFLLDGVALGAEDTVSPYSVNWDTSTATAGAHALTAVARDLAGNITTSATVTVTVVPQLIITLPTNGGTVTTSTFTINYTTRGDLVGANVDHVHFELDNSGIRMDLTLDGTYQWTNAAAGPHTLSGYLAQSNHTQVSGSEAIPVNFTITLPDSIPPTVNVTSPANAATVNGTIAVTATATDNVGVVGVQFKLDSTNIGVEDTVSPYSVNWDTTLIGNGTHVVTAVARDAVGNVTTSSGVTVTVNNSTDPAVMGQWGPSTGMPIVAVNAMLMRNGKIFMFEDTGTTAQVFDPVTGTFTAAPEGYADIFCAGGSELPDGRLLVIGGHGTNGFAGIPVASYFDPATNTWTRAQDMNYARWYPTATTLADGKILATGGGDTSITTYVPYEEVFNPTTNTWAVSPANHPIPSYAHVFVIPGGNGKVVVTGASEFPVPTETYNPTTQTWASVTPVVDGASSIMYRSGLIMKEGTAADSGVNGPAAPTTFVIDMNQASPTWTRTGDMHFSRATNTNLVSLPNGNVMVFGGGTNTNGQTTASAVLPTEEWDPATQVWSVRASMSVPRLYHSVALLLPDGRILSSGGGRDGGVANQLNYQIYSPNYLFKGPRPTLTSVPSGSIGYGSSFFVGTPNGASIASVSLIRPGMPTHGFDMNQRYVPVNFTQTASGLTVQAPSDGTVAPPGSYMLFIVDNNGVPSVSQFVHLPAPWEDNIPPTAPSSLTAVGSLGKASLSWQPATDNLGTVSYNIHRSTVSGFTPSPANLIGQTSVTTYDDLVAAGTYFYLVTAKDTAGNVGPASNEATATVTSDTTPPTVSMTAPADGSTVSGTVTVSASATDNVGVAGVQFLLDGSAVGAEDTVAPYSISWNSSTVANGSHTLSARARDATGNQATSPVVTVTVTNTGLSGLVVSWAFDGNTNDSSPNGHNATTVGAPTYVTGAFGQALNLNGTSQYATASQTDFLDTLSSSTVTLWVKGNALATFQGLFTADAGNCVHPMEFGLKNGRFELWAGATCSSTFNASVAIPNPTAWHHVAYTVDATGNKWYVDGVLQTPTYVTGSAASTFSFSTAAAGATSYWIGRTGDPNELLTGAVDNLRVYNRALSASEIQADMAQ